MNEKQIVIKGKKKTIQLIEREQRNIERMHQRLEYLIITIESYPEDLLEPKYTAVVEKAAYKLDEIKEILENVTGDLLSDLKQLIYKDK